MNETKIRCPVVNGVATTGRLTLTVRGTREASEAAGELVMTPEFLDRFELVRLLGHGASGMVFLAHQRGVDRPVAIKFLMQLDEVACARFLTEGRVLAAVAHPNIVRIYDVGLLGVHPYLVCEYLEGGTLKAKLAHGRLPREEAVQIARDVAEALSSCHHLGVIHRDVKPENILFAGDGTARLADLGIARQFYFGDHLTLTGALIGTPTYMAPEQIRGEPVGVATDIYAVGLVLFEMLSGRPAFAQNTLADLIAAKSEPLKITAAMLPDAPPALVKAVNAAIAFDPANRPSSARALGQLLESPPARPPGDEPPVRAPGRPRWASWLACLGVGLSLLLILPILFAVVVPRPSRPIGADHTVTVDFDRAEVRLRTRKPCQARLDYWPSAGGEKLSVHSARVTDDHRFSIEGLTPGTRYRARPCVGGWWAMNDAEEFVFETRDIVEPGFLCFTVTANVTTATISWQTNVATETTLCYGTTGQPDRVVSNPQQSRTMVHSITLENLVPASDYWYRVTSAGIPGRIAAARSADQRFMTDSGVSDKFPELLGWTRDGATGTASKELPGETGRSQVGGSVARSPHASAAREP